MCGIAKVCRLLRRTSAGLLAFVALGLPACGDDDDGGSAPTETSGTATTQALTKAEFIREADAICGRADDELREIEQELTAVGTSDYDKAADLIRETLDVVERELGDLRALEPPPEDAQTVNETFDFVESQLPLLSDIADATERKDLAEVQSLSRELAEGQAQTQEFAQDYGFKECGSGD